MPRRAFRQTIFTAVPAHCLSQPTEMPFECQQAEEEGGSWFRHDMRAHDGVEAQPSD